MASLLVEEYLPAWPSWWGAGCRSGRGRGRAGQPQVTTVMTDELLTLWPATSPCSLHSPSRDSHNLEKYDERSYIFGIPVFITFSLINLYRKVEVWGHTILMSRWLVSWRNWLYMSMITCLTLHTRRDLHTAEALIYKFLFLFFMMSSFTVSSRALFPSPTTTLSYFYTSILSLLSLSFS